MQLPTWNPDGPGAPCSPRSPAGPCRGNKDGLSWCSRAPESLSRRPWGAAPGGRDGHCPAHPRQGVFACAPTSHHQGGAHTTSSGRRPRLGSRETLCPGPAQVHTCQFHYPAGLRCLATSPPSPCPEGHQRGRAGTYSGSRGACSTCLSIFARKTLEGRGKGEVMSHFPSFPQTPAPGRRALWPRVSRAPLSRT